MWKWIVQAAIAGLTLLLKWYLSGKKRAKASYRKLRNGYEARRQKRIDRLNNVAGGDNDDAVVREADKDNQGK
jgi:hypothetical protein